ncbi:hypothetical protein CLOSYM_00302 [[Clostridium] symbiosum ATCC 14940]|uniref:Uncharacterized protein n=1 Tax=[Clostridium] symbiosum ATCC 14940 TaxID=411472 RepID=A0ABC9U3G4_CLOSY|nr:hypothetical protein CLOSYM_00302 [[Clostridium] symbiosum ATCC 14940]
MHRNGKKTPLIVVKSLLFSASRRATRDFRAEYARKHLAEHNRMNSNPVQVRGRKKLERIW